jgi:hypothetical protein
MMQDYGLHLGPVSEANEWNPRGNREIPALNALHESILKRAGGTWWRPPPRVSLKRSDRRERDAILDRIDGDPAGVKDPRMLLIYELWDELRPLRIGVLRNPVAVRDSLERRAQAQARRQPVDEPGWERLWCMYNERLLAEHGREPFPLINFDRLDRLDEQVRAALDACGVHPDGDSQFLARELPRDHGDWRAQVLVPEALALYDRLAERSLA